MPRKPLPHRHKWTFIAESRYSYNEWCEECGAWRRRDTDADSKYYDEVTIHYPKAKP